jgi:putative flippase GtrA
MSVIQLPRWQDETRPATSDVDIVIPVHNESEQLAASVTSLRSYLDASFPFSATITIADNASTDDTWQIATELADTLVGVEAIHLEQKGRGRALRAAWSRSCSSVVAYMDVDLATELDALLPLVAPLLSGHSDVAIGSRLATGAHVVRGTKREFISRGYNLLLRAALRSACTDAQCGFKAMRREAAMELLPLVEDNEWFFDTEVLVTAQRIGLRIHEVPVDWVDDLDSRVDVVQTALEDLRGVARLLGPSARQRALLRPARPAGPANGGVPTPVEQHPTSSAMGPSRPEWSPLSLGGPGDAALAVPTREVADQQVFADELLRFAGVGAVSTVAYAALFAALEPTLGSYVANTVAIGLCSLGNTAAHRGMAGTARLGLDRRRRVLAAGSLLAVSLSVSTGALAATRAMGLTSLAPELCAVTAANAGAAVVRFAILRSWIFRPEFGTHLSVVEQNEGTAGPDHRLPAGMVSPS